MKHLNTLFYTVPAVFFLAAVVFYQYGLGYLEKAKTMRVESSEMIGEIEKFNGMLSQMPALEKRLDDLKTKEKELSSKFVEGQTPSIAAAFLQETVSTIIASRGGQVTSRRAAKPEGLGKFNKISVSFDVIVPDAASLRDILYSIETHTSYLSISELDVRVRNLRDPNELSARLDVSAITGGGS